MRARFALITSLSHSLTAKLLSLISYRINKLCTYIVWVEMGLLCIISWWWNRFQYQCVKENMFKPCSNPILLSRSLHTLSSTKVFLSFTHGHKYILYFHREIREHHWCVRESWKVSVATGSVVEYLEYPGCTPALALICNGLGVL